MGANLQNSQITATVILGGYLAPGQWVKSVATNSDFVIAADRGVAHCLQLGIPPLICIGDYDSIDASDLNQAQERGWNIISFPQDKDMTDGELAVREAISHGAQRIYLLAGFSGDNRIDHSLAHFFQLAHFSETGVDIRMLDHDKKAYILAPNVIHSVSGKENASLSLIPMDKNVVGVSTKGLRYNLSNEALHFGSTRSLSNEMLQGTATIQLEAGLLLVVIVGDKLI